MRMCALAEDIALRVLLLRLSSYMLSRCIGSLNTECPYGKLQVVASRLRASIFLVGRQPLEISICFRRVHPFPAPDAFSLALSRGTRLGIRRPLCVGRAVAGALAATGNQASACIAGARAREQARAKGRPRRLDAGRECCRIAIVMRGL